MSLSPRPRPFPHRRPDATLAAEDRAQNEVTEGSSDSASDATCESELESMTGKGIQILCSELLELKKASDEDFYRNVYANYPIFIKIFEAAGTVQNDIIALKQHILTQRNLSHDLANSIYLETLSKNTKEIEVGEMKDFGPCSPDNFRSHMYDTLDTVDILLSELQLEEALVVLEMEVQNLQKMNNEDLSSPTIMSYMSAISARKKGIADHFTFLAENPRITPPELKKALFGLCKLGENHQATRLLLKYYDSRLMHNKQEWWCSKPSLYENYIIDLAHIVFSVISQAVKDFFKLFGEKSFVVSEIYQWAREEIEAFSLEFNEFVESIILTSEGGLFLAVESMNSTFSCCSLIGPSGTFLLPDLMRLIGPCMKKILQKHVEQLKKVVGLLAAADTWVLSRFLITGLFREKTFLTGVSGKVEYCLLTSGGRKFLTLMQEFINDLSPLASLQMESSILQGLADLFDEYMRAVECAIPIVECASQSGSQRSGLAHRYLKLLSLLVNSATLLGFFPIIADSISNSYVLSSQMEFSSLTLSVGEAVERIWCCFCKQFINDVMSSVQEKPSGLEFDTFVKYLYSTPQDMMPSLLIQVVFLRLRQIEALSETIFAGEICMAKKLLGELMEAILLWLLNNREYGGSVEDWSHVSKHHSFSDQVSLDVHFLLELAWLGGYFSDELEALAMDAIAKARGKTTGTEKEPDSVVHDERWAMSAAKKAINKLLEIERDSCHTREEDSTSVGEDAHENLDFKEPLDEGSKNLPEEDIIEVLENQNGGFSSPEAFLVNVGKVVDDDDNADDDDNNDSDYDDDDGNSSTCFQKDNISVEDKNDASEGNTEEGKLGNCEELKKQKSEGSLILPDVRSTTDYAKVVHTVERHEADIQATENFNEHDTAMGGLEDSSEGTLTLHDANRSPFYTLDEDTEPKHHLQSMDLNPCTDTGDICYRYNSESIKDDQLQVDDENVSSEIREQILSEDADSVTEKRFRTLRGDSNSVRVRNRNRQLKNVSAAENSEKKIDASSKNRPRWI